MSFVGVLFAGVSRSLQAVSDLIDWLAVDQMFGRISSVLVIYVRPVRFDIRSHDERYLREPNLD